MCLRRIDRRCYRGRIDVIAAVRTDMALVAADVLVNCRRAFKQT